MDAVQHFLGQTGEFLLNLWNDTLSLPLLQQLLLLIALATLAWLLDRKTALWLQTHYPERVVRLCNRLHASLTELLFILYALVGFWLATGIAETGGYPHSLLRIGASLLTAWGLMRLLSVFITSPFWARVLTIGLWSFAALNIVGWLDPTVYLLDRAAITLGNTRVSLLMILKSLCVLALLLWGAGLISSMADRTLYRVGGLTPSQRLLLEKVTRIVLMTIALLISLQVAGLDLGALTVFSGALGLGIGFGLQKVFSNLISGFILLMDKSVKPGDVVAVGQTYGWVNALGARCVSVITRDGKEHLIPNENLITQEVENWSYSSPELRIHIPVGVAYHSDIHKAKRLMLEAVGNHSRILKKPEPTCLILNFGERSVEHEIRCWIKDPANGISNIKSDIYTRIWDLFKEHGIELPVPQRDIYIKEMPERAKTAAPKAEQPKPAAKKRAAKA